MLLLWSFLKCQDQKNKTNKKPNLINWAFLWAKFYALFFVNSLGDKGTFHPKQLLRKFSRLFL
jgi:hypothetical protein